MQMFAGRGFVSRFSREHACAAKMEPCPKPLLTLSPLIAVGSRWSLHRHQLIPHPSRWNADGSERPASRWQADRREDSFSRGGLPTVVTARELFQPRPSGHSADAHAI